VLAASVAASLARAQGTAKVYRIGVLLTTSRTFPATAHLVPAFYEGMRERGYVEGRNLVIEWRGAEGNLARLPALAAELVALKPHVLVGGTGNAALELKKITTTTPIVFVQSADPVGIGLVKTLARPGGNATGFINFSDAIVGKQLELLREVNPQIRRVAVIHAVGDVGSSQQLSAMRPVQQPTKLNLAVNLKTAKALGITIPQSVSFRADLVIQ
jgi:putative ABC transport system substrate-binding protein